MNPTPHQASRAAANTITRAAKARQTRQRNAREWEVTQHGAPGYFIPVRTKNPLNGRSHWRVTQRISKNVRQTVALYLRSLKIRSLPATIVMTRYGPGKLDVGCGLNAALKPVRDGVADVFAVDDADPRYEWIYQQETAPGYGVRIEIRRATA